MGPSSGSWSSCFCTWKRWAFLPLLLTTCAGSWVQDSRVLEGQPCEPHSQPWQIGLFQGVRLICGGVLVAPQWVLTAAHCQKPNYSVRLGEHSLEKPEDSEEEIEVAQSIPHPCYNSSIGNKHDLMLLRLRQPAEVNSKVQPIGLASGCAQPNQECIVSGWGTTTSPREDFPDALHCAQLYIWSQDLCEKAYPGKVSDGMVCAGNNNGADTCQGDSGGPLVCRGALQGITSWGADPCGTADKPGVYTNVCRYTDWIKKTTNAD